MKFQKYNPGRYVTAPRGKLFDVCAGYLEYLEGVTLARQSINRLKPKFIESLSGDVLEIGGFDDYWKTRYDRGRFLNLEMTPGPHIDVVADATNLCMFDDATLGGVLCVSVLEHCPTPQKIISEIHRVLRPGGKAFVSSPWLFESHMEPKDYLRFSRSISDDWFEQFDKLHVDVTNSYFGMVAHVLQDSRLLRTFLGTPFFFVDRFVPKSARWATQITYELEKRAG